MRICDSDIKETVVGINNQSGVFNYYDLLFVHQLISVLCLIYTFFLSHSLGNDLTPSLIGSCRLFSFLPPSFPLRSILDMSLSFNNPAFIRGYIQQAVTTACGEEDAH